jgi:hypothetical protein
MNPAERVILSIQQALLLFAILYEKVRDLQLGNLVNIVSVIELR